jgi:hypothetical protein
VLGVVPANCVPMWFGLVAGSTKHLHISHPILRHSYNDKITQRSRKVACGVAMISINSQAVSHAMFPP